MSHYVDGFVVPVPRANLDAYRHMSERCGKVWREHGALAYWECVEKVMADPRIKDVMDPKNLPFDGMRMFWGGFESIVEL